MVSRHRRRHGSGVERRERDGRLYAVRPRHLAQLQQQGRAGDRCRERSAPDQPIRRHRIEPAEACERKTWRREGFCGLARFIRRPASHPRLSDERAKVIQSVGRRPEVTDFSIDVAPSRREWRSALPPSLIPNRQALYFFFISHEMLSAYQRPLCADLPQLWLLTQTKRQASAVAPPNLGVSVLAFRLMMVRSRPQSRTRHD